MPRIAKKNTDSNRFYRDLGSALRLARLAAGKTQTEVADEIGVSFQQLQKYENGANRIPIEQLVTIAEYFDVSLSTLLSLSEKEREIASLAENLQARSVHALLEGWAQIDDQLMRAAILNLVKRAAA